MTADYKNISRNEWLNLAKEYYEHLFDVLDTYPDEGWKRFTPYLGWTSHDVLAHMTSAIRINFNLLLDKALNGSPVPESNFNFFLRNAEEVKKSRGISGTELAKEFRSEINAILALARANPYIGRLARVSSLAVPPRYKEDFEAAVTGSISLLSALTQKQIKINGDKKKIKKLNKAFWHFWQRTPQAEENIRKFSYLNGL